MQINPFFSVVIPLYNKEKFIEHTLNSVLNQTFTNFEIVIVNDGSGDNSLFVVKKFTDKRIKIVNQENKGLSAARNKGILIAKGKVIALLDADDLWHFDFLKSIKNLYSEFPETSIYGTDYLEKYSDKNILEPKKNINPAQKKKAFLIKDFFLANLFQSIICQSSLAFKKEIAEDMLFNESINYAEDVDFYLKCFTKYKLAYKYTPLATILYNVPNQITGIGLNDKTIPNLDFYEKKHPNNSSLKKYLDLKRYMYAIQYKLIKDKVNFIEYTKNIDYNNISIKQKLLLKSPLFILKLLKFIKKEFLKRNIRFTSFSG